MLTWTELVKAEPMLAMLELATLRLAEGAEGNEAWCKTAVWYREVKPHLVRAIGRGREMRLTPGLYTTGDLDDQFVTAAELFDRVDHDPRNDDRFLFSSEVYDVAYDYLLDLLPDCTHEPTVSCG
jgi:hypothetical protein